MDDAAVRLAAVRMLLGTIAEPRGAAPVAPDLAAAITSARSVDDVCAALNRGRAEVIAMLARTAAG